MPILASSPKPSFNTLESAPIAACKARQAAEIRTETQLESGRLG
jgi:hypothetical protein